MLVIRGNGSVFICSLTSFRPTEWSQCVPEQPNWVDSTVSCLLLCTHGIQAFDGTACLGYPRQRHLSKCLNKPPRTTRRRCLNRAFFEVFFAIFSCFGCCVVNTFKQSQQRIKCGSELINRFSLVTLGVHLSICCQCPNTCGFNETVI